MELVTIGTDGYTNWVRLADGQKFNLGTISVLKFVTKLMSSRHARQVLAAFNQDGEALLSVNLDQMWEVLKPQRARWAHSSLFMPNVGTMKNLDMALRTAETHLVELVQASKAGKSSETLKLATDRFKEAVSQVTLTSEDASEFKATSLRFASNVDVVEKILVKSEKTANKIAELEKAGRPFNAARARQDVSKVIAQVSNLVHESDMSSKQVCASLEALMAQADRVYQLFELSK